MVKRERELIYLASPFTHVDKIIEKERYREACKCAAALIKRGKLVFCPIAMAYPINRYGKLGSTWSVWRTIDLALLDKCDSLMILTLPGWERSVGVMAELDFALEHDKNVFHLDPITYDKTRKI